MKTKLKTYKSGWTVTLDYNPVNGFFTVLVRSAAGDTHDKVSCDTESSAYDYWRAFNKIAKTA